MPLWLIPILETFGSQILAWLLKRAERDTTHPDPKIALAAQERVDALTRAQANLKKI